MEDKELKQKYWTIMNSWGENFGEMGTMRLLRQDSEDWIFLRFGKPMIHPLNWPRWSR